MQALARLSATADLSPINWQVAGEEGAGRWWPSWHAHLQQLSHVPGVAAERVHPSLDLIGLLDVVARWLVSHLKQTPAVTDESPLKSIANGQNNWAGPRGIAVVCCVCLCVFVLTIIWNSSCSIVSP